MLPYLPKLKSSIGGIWICCLFILSNYISYGQCTSYIGEIATPDKGSYYLCYGAYFTFQLDSISLMENQDLFYVFHKHENPFQNDSIIEINQTGLYQNYETIPGEIFATGIIAEENDSTIFNYDDPCLVLSNTVSIINLSPIKIEMWENCRPFTGFSFSVSGGLPEYSEDSFYEVSGSHFDGKLEVNEVIKVETENFGFIPEHKIKVSDDAGCEANYHRGRIGCYRLPVQLVSFDGQITEAGNLLEWVSSNEVNIDFYKIEVSKNGIDWMVLGTLNAEGTPLEITEYEFLDETLCDEICYYKLFIVDKDGTISNAGIIQLVAPNYFKTYPTLANNILNVEYNIDVPVRLLIFDTMGRTVFSSNKESNQAYNKKEIDLSHLPASIYYLHISSDEFSAIQKFVIQR